ncbi:hypothetical protein ABZ626_12250 [Streptomyces longispororuber]|uniref:hypothetical protein n=1 Tax=Streptomyces longispororuber TaxID=68230 RepID=UPI0033FA23B7
MAFAGASIILSAAYLLETGPFSRPAGTDTIKAAELCDSLGSRVNAARRLSKILPDRAVYSFQETPGRRATSGNSTYTSSCFIRDENKIVMSARTEMMRAESPQNWVQAQVVDRRRNVEQYQSFQAGEKGIASPVQAAIFVPCVSKGKVPGGAYNLSVSVHLKQAAEIDAKEAREELTGLVTGVARFAHQRAGCDLPSELPTSS